MRAARFWGRGDVRVESIEDPGPPPPGWVRLAIEACGICGTDLEEYTDGPVIVPTTPHPLTGRSAPLTLGHEAVGVVTDAGEGVATLPPGTPVAVEANLFCGSCWYCAQGRFPLCDTMAAFGLMTDGGLAEFALAPAYMCIPYSGGTATAMDMVLAEPLAVAVRAVARGEVRPGSTVGVVGCGTVGLLAIQAARRGGADTVIAVDPLRSRRELAIRLGADLSVEPAEAAQASGDLDGGRGPDVVIEAAGTPTASAAAIRWTRRGGRTVLLGVFDGDIPVDSTDLLLGEKEIVASLSHVVDTDFATAVTMIQSGHVQTAPLVTDRIPLDRVVEDGFRALAEEPDAHLKVVVTPNGSAAGAADGEASWALR